MAPAKKRGRPRKYFTEEEQQEANRQASHRYYHRTSAIAAAAASSPVVYVHDARAILEQPVSAPPTIPALGIQADGLTIPPDDDLGFRLDDDENNAPEVELESGPGPGPGSGPEPELEPEPGPELGPEPGPALRPTPEPDSTVEEMAEAVAALGSLRLSPSPIATSSRLTPDEDRDVDWTAILASQLQQFHGCTDAVHRQQLADHELEEGEHWTLSEMVQKTAAVFPLSLKSEGMQKTQDVSYDRILSWGKQLIGKTPWSNRLGPEPADRPPCICLQKSNSPSEPTPSPTLQAFDIDSVLGFPTSLAFAKQGLKFNLCPQFVSNLDADVHLQLPVPIEGGVTTLMPLHKVPHCQLGRLGGMEEVCIYVFFPGLFGQIAKTLPKQELLQRWVDAVLLPTIYSQVDATTSQHYPASYRHSKMNSRAKNLETLSKKDKSAYQHQALYHYLQADVLEEVWAIVQASTDEPGFRQFQGAQLFLNGKGMKVLTAHPTWSETWTAWLSRWETVVDSRFLPDNCCYVDLGKEICHPSTYLDRASVSSSATGPQTLLWRSCCLESYWTWINSHSAETTIGTRSKYNTAMLRDASGMTICTRTGSTAQQQGLIYSQFYNSDKEIFDAAKTYPFTNGALEILALDRRVRQTWQSVTASQRYNADTLLRSYFSSKARCHEGLTKSYYKSFGIREEHRVSIAFARRLDDHMQIQEGVQPRRQPYWQLGSRSYLRFLYHNLNKFLAVFEYIYVTQNVDFVSWEASKMMIMLLRMARLCYGSHRYSQEVAVWWDKRTFSQGGRTFYGLGVGDTMAQHGYGFLKDRFDWKGLRLESKYSDHTLFGNVHMERAYYKRWVDLKNIKDDFLLIEKLGRWLEVAIKLQNRAMRDFILEGMLWVCLEHFRKEVFYSIKESVDPDYLEDALAGQILLCKDNLDRVLVERPHVVDGNRMRFKDAYDFVAFLWEFDDKLERKHWECKGYRLLYRRVLSTLHAHAPRVIRQWREELHELFLQTNWIVPYPNHLVFWQRTKQSERMWLSLYNGSVSANLEDDRQMSWNVLYTVGKNSAWIVGRGVHQHLQGCPSVSPVYKAISWGEIFDEFMEIEYGGAA